MTPQCQPKLRPPPPPLSILQKLLMRERIHTQTWNLVCDTRVSTQTRTPPPPQLILQKLLMRERIPTQTWNLVCDTTVTTKTQTNPPPAPISILQKLLLRERIQTKKIPPLPATPINIAKIPYESWHLWGGRINYEVGASSMRWAGPTVLPMCTGVGRGAKFCSQSSPASCFWDRI